MTRRVPVGLRSYLFAPGNHVRRLEKVFGAGADAVILDLEDAVAASEKAAARDMVVAALAKPRAVRAYVRVNGIDSVHWQADLEAVAGTVDGVVFPKVESLQQAQALTDAVAQRERQAGSADGALDVMVMIETARGLAAVDAIAAASPRIGRLAFGGADYTHDLDLEWTAEERELDYARARLVHASRVAGIEPPVDTPVLAVRDYERVLQSARNARRMGFQAKLCIHPDQLAPCHEVFTPTPGEIERARAVVAAFRAAEARGDSAIEVDGVFVDYPVAYKAERIVALAERLKRGA
jgi:citrate lyase subunit beta/citryl-CoA lyase